MRINLEAKHIKGISTRYTQKPANSNWKLMDHKTETVYKTICFTGEKIIGLKERTGASTSFIAVATQFWRCVIKAREIAEEGPVYFIKEDVLFASGVIEELISVCTARDQVNHIIEWVESGGRDVVDLLMEIDWKNSTSVSSSLRFPVYEIDYGWVSPLNVQAASMNAIGGMFVDGLKDGSIVVSTRLPPCQMETLTKILFLPTH
ncbi:hypothetical protein SUGI_0990310 [Cryptomeria japonica]|nr:hypothetical protein SUGI_0990310 [Cryptomeria japonica]